MKLTDLDRNNWGNHPDYKNDFYACEDCGKEKPEDMFNWEYGCPLCNECFEDRARKDVLK